MPACSRGAKILWSEVCIPPRLPTLPAAGRRRQARSCGIGCAKGQGAQTAPTNGVGAQTTRNARHGGQASGTGPARCRRSRVGAARGCGKPRCIPVPQVLAGGRRLFGPFRRPGIDGSPGATRSVEVPPGERRRDSLRSSPQDRHGGQASSTGPARCRRSHAGAARGCGKPRCAAAKLSHYTRAKSVLPSLRNLASPPESSRREWGNRRFLRRKGGPRRRDPTPSSRPISRQDRP